MNTMKKFFKYFLLFVSIYILVTLLTNWATTNKFHNFKNYNILTDSPVVTVDECKVSKVSGEISGKITNNTGKTINRIYLKIDGYNKNNVLQGTKYKEIQYFHPNEECPFNIGFNWKEIKRLDISLVDNKEGMIGINLNNEKTKKYLPAATLLLLFAM